MENCCKFGCPDCVKNKWETAYITIDPLWTEELKGNYKQERLDLRLNREKNYVSMSFRYEQIYLTKSFHGSKEEAESVFTDWKKNTLDVLLERSLIHGDTNPITKADIECIGFNKE